MKQSSSQLDKMSTMPLLIALA